MEPFHNFSMFYLNFPKDYIFKQSSSLEVSTFTLRIHEISKIDQEGLNALLFKVDPNIPKVGEKAYINSKNAVFFNTKGEIIYPPALSGKKWMLKVRITGYKLDEQQNYSMIWKLVWVMDTIASKPDCGDVNCIH